MQWFFICLSKLNLKFKSEILNFRNASLIIMYLKSQILLELFDFNCINVSTNQNNKEKKMLGHKTKGMITKKKT